MINQTLKVILALNVFVIFVANAESEAPVDASKIVSEVCVACHGQDGNAMVTGAPKLGGQKADYLTKALMDYKNGTRNNAIMAAFSVALTEEEMEALGKYFEAQPSSLYVPDGN